MRAPTTYEEALAAAREMNERRQPVPERELGRKDEHDGTRAWRAGFNTCLTLFELAEQGLAAAPIRAVAEGVIVLNYYNGGQPYVGQPTPKVSNAWVDLDGPRKRVGHWLDRLYEDLAQERFKGRRVRVTFEVLPAEGETP